MVWEWFGALRRSATRRSVVRRGLVLYLHTPQGFALRSKKGFIMFSNVAHGLWNKVV